MPGSIRSIRTFDATPQRYDSDEEYPLKVGKPVLINHGLRSQISLIQLPPSPADSETHEMRAPAEPSAEESRLIRPIHRGAPGDGAIVADQKSPEQQELARRKSQYYKEAFAYRESHTSARERVSKESIVMAEVRTNVIIDDEYSFITDLSYALSTRYQRPESCIVVTITHSACLLYAGSFDPAYVLTINAIPSQLQPVTNKRNAALLGKSMEETLGVVPERGLIKFIPIAEENLATAGQTLAGSIDQLNAEEGGNTVNGLSLSKSNRRHSMRSLRGKRTGQLPTHEERVTPTPTRGERNLETPPLPAIPSTPSKADLRAEKAQKMGRRRSFMAAVFGR